MERFWREHQPQDVYLQSPLSRYSRAQAERESRHADFVRRAEEGFQHESAVAVVSQPSPSFSRTPLPFDSMTAEDVELLYPLEQTTQSQPIGACNEAQKQLLERLSAISDMILADRAHLAKHMSLLQQAHEERYRRLKDVFDDLQRDVLSTFASGSFKTPPTSSDQASAGDRERFTM